MRAALVGVILLGLSGPVSAAEKAVRRDETAKEPEARHPAPARDTPAPTWEPEPTSTPDPTPTPEPTPTPDWRSRAVPRGETGKERNPEAEARHPRPQTSKPVVMPTDPPIAWVPAPTPTPDPPADVERRHPRRSRFGRGHLGPHFHERRFVPQSCPHDAIHDGAWSPEDDPRHPNYEGMAALRLLVDPPETRVFVDGHFAGLVEDFDGLFQRLYLPEGCHELALVLAGHRTHRVRIYATRDRALKIGHSMRTGEGTDAVDLSEGLCRAERPPAPPSSTHDFEIDRQHWFLAYGRLTTVVGLVRGDLGARSSAGRSTFASKRAAREVL